MKSRDHRTQLGYTGRLLAMLVVMTILAVHPPGAAAQADDPSPPAAPVKLIFIHHSCGENWLADDQGALGVALGANNYFVSDTNYGWGPDSIGDRTDIIDWPEWFTGADSGRYLGALYAESGQNSWYTRTLADPGGENQIIMFKSCFPNSNLEGSPGDPPSRGDSLSVGNAKAIYNELLTYFATRPDKLFVAITAPPLLDPTYAANARGFNTWLVQDWLSGYAGSNVAVWDFYNVLTGPDNHHRFNNGAIEYVNDSGGDTLFYPTDGDEHPSPTGNRKATEEFVPVLNSYYNRWQLGAPAGPAPSAQPPPEPTAGPPPEEAGQEPAALPAPAPAIVGGILEDFETETNEWQVFSDGHSGTLLTCTRQEGEAYSGSSALNIEYDVTTDGWAACSLVYPAPMNWLEGDGLGIYLRAGEAGQPVVIIAYGSSAPDELLHFEYRAETNQEAVDGWQRVDIAWQEFVLASWQGDPATPFDPSQAMGLALSFDPETHGWLKVDDVSLLAFESAAPPPDEAPAQPTAAEAATEPPAAETATAPPAQEEDVQPSVTPSSAEPPTAEEAQAEEPAAVPGSEEGSGGLCPGSAAIGLITLTGVFGIQKRQKNR